eukprot:403348388
MGNNCSSIADNNLNQGEFNPIEKQINKARNDERDRSLISMKNKSSVKIRVSSQNKKDITYINEDFNDDSTAANHSIPKKDLSMQTFRQTLNFSRFGNDSTLSRDQSFKILSSQTTLKKNKSQQNIIITPQKKRKLDDSKHEINQLSSIKKVQSPVKDRLMSTINSSMKQKVQKRFLSDKILREIKEISGKQITKTNLNGVDKCLEQMKSRETRRIKFENESNLRISYHELQIIQEDSKPTKIQPINMEIFDYPIKILSFLSQIPDDVFIYEGELMKYLPGFSFQYFKKYAMITKNEFKYYKNELMSFKHVFPTYSVSLDDIVKVQRVNCEIPVIKCEEQVFNSYQFEIFVNNVEQEIESSILMPQNYIEESKVNITQMNHQQEQDSFDISRINRFRRTNRLNEMYGGRGDRRLLESPERKRNRSLQRFNSETRFQSPGHLMPKMIERRMLRFNSVSNVRKLGNQNRQDKIYRCLDQQLVKQQLNQVLNLKDADAFIQQLQDDLAIPKLKEKFESRNPAGWIKNISGFQAWSNREAEWFNAENRLLFGCPSEIECDRWVLMLNLLVWIKQQNHK